MGTAVVTFTFAPKDRATWDTIKSDIVAFLTAHPQVVISRIEYTETG